MRSAGVNFPDVLIIENKYQFKPPLPFTPGGEVAGEVKAVGEGVTDLAVGDRVLANCGWQGFAEEILLPAPSCFKIPDAMDYQAASALLLTYGTSHYALKQRGKLRAGEDLVVLGAAGGVGIAAVEIGKVMGARVIAAASSPEKLAVCREHGADEVIDYSQDDLKMIQDSKLGVMFSELPVFHMEPKVRWHLFSFNLFISCPPFSLFLFG